jgi:hypothetical protein
MLLGTLITAESTPDYDGWGWDSYWSKEEWMQWHKALATQHGITQANSLWKEAWFSQGAWEHGFNWYKYDKEFAGYFKNQGIDVGNTISNLLTTATSAIDKTVDSAGNIVKNTTNAASKLTGTAEWLLPTLLASAGVGIIYLIYKEAKTGSIRDLKNLTPKGVAKALNK